MLMAIVLIVVFLLVAYWAFVNFYPSFGGDVSADRKLKYRASKQFKEGIFVNEKDVPKDAGFSEMLTIARKFFFQKVENGRPTGDLKVQHLDATTIASYEGTRLIWFGHSSFLLQMDGKNILIDPMFGKVAAPHPLLGTKRFNEKPPIAIEELPKIDAVIISHDHYDHLDYGSIKKLRNKVASYYVPLGVGVHLEAWGIGGGRIQELDWWEETTLADIQLVCTPAQHFSGRKFTNGQATLWSSWVIKSNQVALFFSGDSGYGPHFTEIGKRYGPFDLAMMECGQYNEMWPDIHMFPEETAQAGMDVGAKSLMPIHWGAFKLALHSWTDPIERVSRKAEELKIPLVTPRIGQPMYIDALPEPSSEWWEF